MNIIVKSNVRALKGLRVSPRIFPTSQICDTHAYVRHLIACANQTRLVLETQDSFASLVMHLCIGQIEASTCTPPPRAYPGHLTPLTSRAGEEA